MDGRHTAPLVYTTQSGSSRRVQSDRLCSRGSEIAETRSIALTAAVGLPATCDNVLTRLLRKGSFVDMQGNALSFPSSHDASRRLRCRLMAAILALLLGGIATAVQATPNDTGMSRDQLRKINADILKARRQLNSTQQQQSTARQAVKNAESALASTHAQLDELIRQQRDVNQRLAQLDQQAGSLRKDRERQQQALSEQLAALYRMGHEPQLKLLLEQHNATRLERYQHYFNALDHARQERLATLQRLDTEVTTNRQATAQEHKQLVRLIEAQKDRERTLTQQQTSRQKALDSLAHSFQSDQARLQSLTQEREQAEAVIEQIERAVAVEHARMAAAKKAAAEKRRQQQHSGNTTAPAPDEPLSDGLTDEELNAEAPDNDADRPVQTTTPRNATPRHNPAWNGRWPVDGRMIASFKQGDGVDRNGILIAASAGAPIHAMAPGQVVFADWLNGFGYLVIVDHGRAMTVYAHNQRNMVSTGDRVRKGSIIGTVGDTGGRNSPALHFEVRRQGRPIDPESWSG